MKKIKATEYEKKIEEITKSQQKALKHQNRKYSNFIFD